MPKKPTNADLLVRAVKAEQEAEDWRRSDKAHRDVLSKILGSTKRTQFSNDVEPVTLSWMEISFRIGKLSQEAAEGSLASALTQTSEEAGALRTELSMIKKVHHRTACAQPGGCPDCR